MNLQQELAQRVRDGLARNDMTQRDLADSADLSEKHVSQMLAGKSGTVAAWDQILSAVERRDTLREWFDHTEDRLRPLSAPVSSGEAGERERQRQRDNLPCPSCGGDRLRPTFRDPNACHVARPAPVVTPSAEPVHWIGDAPTSLHGNGAASFAATSRHWQSVTCTLCLSLRDRAEGWPDSATPSTEGGE